ncbi:type VI secretion system secreted protein Hcp [Duganella sp. 1224]|uniref:Hcp family type VI secretion system effector n=1 Tax=Duganella sp. 1224 TaxID=2587052 RepID=UPI0015C72698|nr:type VI secretion system tube protein Hcp [Duganella sp. 1224]NYE62549.1 type VI secretion system secreted protein Hcp [Duganella sp. 1224]
MAIDVYLQIDGIKGESSDDEHQGWIECTSVSWLMSQPKSATASTGAGHTAERCELSDISLTKLVDLASPMLAQHCACGNVFRKANIEFLRADGDGQRVKYYEIEMENVLIAHLAPSISPGDVLTEQVSLKFGKIKWRYTRQKISGGVGGNTSGGWCASSNRPI